MEIFKNWFWHSGSDRGSLALPAKEKQQGDWSKEAPALAVGVGLSLVSCSSGDLCKRVEGDKPLPAWDAIPLAQMSIMGYGAMQS